MELHPASCYPLVCVCVYMFVYKYVYIYIYAFVGVLLKYICAFVVVLFK